MKPYSLNDATRPWALVGESLTLPMGQPIAVLHWEFYALLNRLLCPFLTHFMNEPLNSGRVQRRFSILNSSAGPSQEQKSGR